MAERAYQHLLVINLDYQGDKMKKTKLILKMKLLVLLSATLCCLFAAPFGSFTWWDAYAQDSCGTIDPPLPGDPPCLVYNTYVIITLCYVCQYYGGDEASCLATVDKLSAMTGLDPACVNCGDGFCSVGETCPQDQQQKEYGKKLNSLNMRMVF